MIEQQGRVTAIEGDEALVRMGGRSGCAACDAGQGCGAGLFGRLLNRSQAEVRVENRLGLSPGAAVLIGLPETTLLALVMRLYGWPLLAGLAGALLAHVLLTVFGMAPGFLNDVLVLSAGLAAGWPVLRGLHRRPSQVFTPRSLRMLDAGVQLDCGSFDRNP